MKIAIRTRVVKWWENVPTVNIAGRARPIRGLLGDGDSNTKLAKGSKTEWYTCGLSLAPAHACGIGNTCAFASRACTAACLFGTGHGGCSVDIPACRIAKTIIFYREREWFLTRLRKDIANAKIRAAKLGKSLAIRLNMFSDLAWEKICPDIFADNPEVMFYDYTKNPRRVGLRLPNYWVTFSRSDENGPWAFHHLDNGGNVSFVFHGPTPTTYRGHKVYDGDVTDLRFTDPRSTTGPGRIIALKLKYFTLKARDAALASGFAINTN